MKASQGFLEIWLEGKYNKMMSVHSGQAQEPPDGEVKPLCWPMAPLRLSLGNPEGSNGQQNEATIV